MAISRTTSVAELRARLRAQSASPADRSEQQVLSIQQSLRVEGYEVGADIIRDALRTEVSRTRHE